MTTIKRELVRNDVRGFDVWRETSVLPTYTVMPIDGDMEAIPEEPDEDMSELITEIEGASGQHVTLDVARTPAGGYIGTPDVAEVLCGKHGIRPETIPGHEVCSIGFRESGQKWFGWSHRAIFGFTVGDVAKKGDCVCSSGWTDDYLAEHPEADVSLPVGFEAKTLDDAKRMAIAFAESVS